MGWFYGLVRENSGKIRIWEIMITEIGKGKKKETIIWGHRGFTSWILKEPLLVIKDLLNQKRKFKRLFKEKEFEDGNKAIAKYFNKLVKKTKSPVEIIK